MISAGVGFSKNKDPYQAGYEAITLAIEQAGGKPDFLFAFSSVSLDQHEIVRGIQDAGNKTPFIGCSDAGEITNEGPAQNGVGVMAVRADMIRFTTGIAKDIKSDARAAGRSLAKEIKNQTIEPSRSLVMLPDVLTGNGADIVRGIQDVFGENFPIVGGAAGDDFLFKQTYQYRDGEVESGAVAGVGLAGAFSMGIGVRHGWVPLGPPMKVTKAQGTRLYELDGKPAIHLYEDYFGVEAEQMKKEPLARIAITYPLGIKIPDLDEYLIRDPITVNEDGSITCAAEIPEGSEVRLMIGSKEKAIQAAQDAAHKLMRDFEQQKSAPKFLLIFNCIAREKLFGVHAREEIEAIMGIVGRNVPTLGFYTYGEQAPMGGEIHDSSKIYSRFYNETAVLFAVGE